MIDVLFRETCNLLKKQDVLAELRKIIKGKDWKQWEKLRNHLLKVEIPRFETCVNKFRKKGLEWTDELAESVAESLLEHTAFIKRKLEVLQELRKVEKLTVSNAL